MPYLCEYTTYNTYIDQAVAQIANGHAIHWRSKQIRSKFVVQTQKTDHQHCERKKERNSPKRKVLENTGLFNETQRYAEDINYWLKVSLNNKLFILDEELLLAGEGKRTFGISGLSANLTEMEKGFHRNLKEMFEMKKLSPIEYQLYRIFYRIKYIIRISRNKFLKLQGK